VARVERADLLFSDQGTAVDFLNYELLPKRSSRRSEKIASTR
jgi:hypothetical protein